MTTQAPVVVIDETELDFGSTGPVVTRVRAEIATWATASVVLDMQRVTFIDSAGIGMLVGLHNDLTLGGGTVRMVAIQPSIERTLNIVGLMDMFTD